MTRREWCKRYLFFLAGLFINSFGVSFITKAALGTSPISSVPYTLSLGFSPTLGMFTLYMSIVLILIQMILLRKDFPRQYLLQIPVSFLFSWFIDMTMELLGFLSPAAYPAKVICLLLGCAILGFGVFMEMAAGVVMLPGECFVRTKVAFDTSITVAAAIIGIVLYRELAGVREGTIVAAVLVGMIARRLNCTIGPRVNLLLVR